MAQKTDPELWERIKKQLTAGDKGGNPGQWSARKAQMAVQLYKKAGGGYKGKKDPKNPLSMWTKQDWRTKSGKPSLETGERYLPAKAIQMLTPEQYRETSKKKRAGMKEGKQFVAQPEDIKMITSAFR